MGPCEEQAGLRERSKQPVMVLLAECLDLHPSGLRSSAHSREWRGALSPSRSSNCHPSQPPLLRQHPPSAPNALTLMGAVIYVLV